MASTDSITPWNPALRPNTEEHAEPTSNEWTSPPEDEPSQTPISEPSYEAVPQDDFTAQPTNWTSPLDGKSAQPPLPEPSSDGAPLETINSRHVDAWFSEDNGEDNWLEESPPVAGDDSTEAQAPETTETAGDNLTSIPFGDQKVDPWSSENTGEENWLGEPAPVAVDDSAQTQAPPETAESAEQEAPSADDASHAKEFDWTADHADGESKLFAAQDASDDPFDFMPPSDRTNSFPPVPPLDAPKYSHSRSLSRTQAEDVMAESENGDDRAFEGDERNPENDASATRYEEGVPLLSEERDPENDNATTGYEGGVPLSPQESSSHAAPDRAPEAPNTSSQIDNAFADEEDDFFNNIRDTASPAVSAPSPPWSLDRKSTMQAMGIENTLSSTQAPALSDAEEDEEEEETGAAVGNVPEVAGAAPGPTDTNSEAPKADEAALAAKWSEVFADDDLDEELLFDNDVAESKELDPAALFGSDDEGFLDDDDEDTSPAAAAPSSVPVVGTTTAEQPSSVQDRYTPQAPVTSSQPNFTPAAPAAPYTVPAPAAPYQQPPVAQPPVQSQFGAPYGTPQPRPELPRAQSFADKAKGGYTSPYDLPMEVVKAPKKRASMQQLSRPSAASAPPLAGSSLRSTSMYHQGPPSSAGVSPIEQGSGSAPPTGQKPPPLLPPKAKEAFFEDLPMTSRPRPASRQSRTSSPAPGAPPPGPPGGRLPMHPPPMQAGPVAGPPATTYQPAPAPPATTYQPAPAPPATTYQPAPPATAYQPAPPATTYQPAPAATGYQPAPADSTYQPAPPATTNEPTPSQAPATGPSPGLAPAPNLIRSTSSGAVPALVKPETVNPYAPAPAQHPPAPDASAPANKYSPAPAQNTHLNGTIPPAVSGRYSPVPPISRQASSNYAPAPHPAHSAPILPHQPRTSSPLAHFETTARRSGSQPITMNGEAHVERRTSLPHQPSFSRVPSLPTTRELDEENEQAPPNPSQSGESQSPTVAESRYSPAPQGFRQTPPPPLTHIPGQATLSPPKRSPGKRSSYSPLPPQPAVPGESEFVPPPRSYSQSPSTMQRTISGPYTPAAEPIRRPSSVQTPASPKSSQAADVAAAYKPSHRARAPSLTLSMIPPTDGRENDPLQRWKGVPLITWGVGGTVITSFPKNVPRYGINQPAPMIVRTPGELKITHVKDLLPLGDRLAKFPGPLKGKSKKKETVAWLSTGIEILGHEVPELSYAQNPSHDDKRVSERLLLWKILRVLIENDGVLEGTPAVQQAVRDILVPGLDEPKVEDVPSLVGTVAGSLHQQGAPVLQADAVDPAGIELMRKHLMVGDREKATWAAVDKRLWGHAMLIANTVSPDLYKQVAQEFVRKEVNHPGYSNESVAALYKVLSGSHEECVDELVPVHARAGLQLMSTTSANGPTKDALDGLDKWRETLCLILSNRSPGDARALVALGELLSAYGRAEAAHICFIFGRQASVFGGPDDARSNFVLVGADHKRQGDHLFKDTEALLLSEVYEYGLSLAGGVNATAPHLAAYKLQLAATLAEYGQQSRALEYCAAISSAFNAQTKRSPYYSPALEHAVNDFIGRLKQAPREESGSWIPKPSMNKVSDSMWSTFNKFVSGDDDGAGGGSNGENGADSGPFARVAGGTTPNLSRSPSASNLDIYGASNIGYPGQPPAVTTVTSYPPAPAQPGSRTSSRYAPGPQPGAAVPNPYEAASAPYTPRTSGELTRNFVPLDSSRPSTGYQQQQQYNPAPLSQSAPQTSPLRTTSGYGVSPELSYLAQPQAPSYQPQAPATPPGSGYTPLGVQESPYAPQRSNEPSAPANVSGDSQPSYGYQAPSYGFEPPSMTAEPEEVAAADDSAGEQGAPSGGYEAPSFQPYEYEPPSYEPDAGSASEDESKPKKGMMDDDEDDIPALKPQSKTKAEKDRENEEMIRRVAEQEAKQAAEKASKKGWGFGGWFGGGKKDSSEPAPNKPIKANLGEQSSFVYDPELKRWINKKGGAEATEAKKATPPPPRGPATPPPPMSSTPPPPPASTGGVGLGSPPPPGSPRVPSGPLPTPQAGAGPNGLGVPPPMARSASNHSIGNRSVSNQSSGPPSRPTTSMSNASSIDDLLSAAGPRKPGQKKARKGGRYVDVMAK